MIFSILFAALSFCFHGNDSVFDFPQLPRSSGCRFMNLPCLQEFGCFSAALQSSRNLESIVIDLSGCGQVSIDARMELHQSIKSLKWFRGSLDTWVNIEGLPNRSWFARFSRVDFGGVLKARCSRSFRSMWQHNSVPASCHLSAQCTLSQPGLADPAPQAVTNQVEKMQRQRLTALSRRCLMKANRFHAAILRVILFTLLRAVIVKGTTGWALAEGFAIGQMLGARMWSLACLFLHKQWQR